MSDKYKQLIAVVFIYAIALFFLVGSFSMKQDAGLFPRLIAITLMIINTLYAINILRGKAPIKKKIDEIVPKKMKYILVISLVYIILLKYLGYVITTAIFLPTSMYLLGVKRPRTLLVVTVLTVLIIYISFGVMLKVPMPKSFLGI